MKHLLLIACAGALGALSRYGLSLLVHELAGRGFPWGTAVVNILGCMIFGVVVVLAEDRGLLGPEAAFVLTTGFLGAFTTFSSLVYESAQLVRAGQAAGATVNVLGQITLGFAGFYAGQWLTRLR